MSNNSLDDNLVTSPFRLTSPVGSGKSSRADQRSTRRKAVPGTTIQEALACATLYLKHDQIDSARLDSEVLLGHVLEQSRAQLYTEPSRRLSALQEKQFRHLLERRLRKEPVAYIIKHKEFLGRDFFVDERVLIPRPETELLVEQTILAARQKQRQDSQLILADIGTGSGAIAVSLALEFPQAVIYASDISPAALHVAEKNCTLHHVTNVQLCWGSLLAPLPEPPLITVANLPYIGHSERELLPPEIHDYEPHLALFSGNDGLNHFVQLLSQAATSLTPGSLILLELGYMQRPALQNIVSTYLPHAHTTFAKDYAGWDRYLTIEL